MKKILILLFLLSFLLYCESVNYNKNFKFSFGLPFSIENKENYNLIKKYNKIKINNIIFTVNIKNLTNEIIKINTNKFFIYKGGRKELRRTRINLIPNDSLGMIIFPEYMIKSIYKKLTDKSIFVFKENKIGVIFYNFKKEENIVISILITNKYYENNIVCQNE